jgi:hypothetical protein
MHLETTSDVVISPFIVNRSVVGCLLTVLPVARMTDASEGALPLVRLLFGLIFLAGLKLTYDGWIAKPPTGQ